MGTPLGPKYILYSYMERLGLYLLPSPSKRTLWFGDFAQASSLCPNIYDNQNVDGAAGLMFRVLDSGHCRDPPI